MYDQRKQWIKKFRQDYVDGIISYEEYMSKVADVDRGEYDGEDSGYDEAAYSGTDQENAYFQQESNQPGPEPVNTEIFYGFDQNREAYRRQRKIKHLLVLLTIVISISVLGTIGGMIGSLNYEVYDWPSNNETAQLLPEPEGEITYISVYDGDYLYATVKLRDDRDTEDYIVACMEKGFTKNKQSSQYENYYDFQAYNEEGWEINVYNYDGEMNISLYSPTWLQKINTVETKVPQPQYPLPDGFYQEGL